MPSEPRRASEAPLQAAGEGPWHRLERLLVIAIAAHSAAIGLAALVATEWGVRFSGFAGAEPLFFPRQVGIFHVVVAVTYLVEHIRWRSVTILLTTKCIAVAFLTVMLWVDRLPWVVPLSAVGDGAMAAAVIFVRLRVRRA